MNEHYIFTEFFTFYSPVDIIICHIIYKHEMYDFIEG